MPVQIAALPGFVTTIPGEATHLRRCTRLVEIYKSASDEDIREAALDGLMISGDDEGLLELYRSSDNSSEKKELLEYLVMTGSDEVWSIIDSALDGDD